MKKASRILSFISAAMALACGGVYYFFASIWYSGNGEVVFLTLGSAAAAAGIIGIIAGIIAQKNKKAAGLLMIISVFLLIAGFVLSIFFTDWDRLVFFLSLTVFVPFILFILGARFTLAQEKKPGTRNSAVPPQSDIATGYTPVETEYISLAKHVLLCIFTFGIWQLIWVYRTTEFLNQVPGCQRYNPTSKLLLFIFVPFYSIFWFYRHGERVDMLIRTNKAQGSDVATLCLLFSIIMPIVAYILLQAKINDAVISRQQPESFSHRNEYGFSSWEKNNNNQADFAEQLLKLKALLDSGIVTQEEFDAKKKQILGL